MFCFCFQLRMFYLFFNKEQYINLSITKNNRDDQSLWDSLLLILKLLYFTTNVRKQLESREKVSQYVIKIICGKKYAQIVNFCENIFTI